VLARLLLRKYRRRRSLSSPERGIEIPTADTVAAAAPLTEATATAITDSGVNNPTPRDESLLDKCRTAAWSPSSLPIVHPEESRRRRS